MKSKTRVIIDDFDLFEEMMICSLRYALGRRTYITSSVPLFIMQNSISQKTKNVMLEDLQKYFEDRQNGKVNDDEFDCACWQTLFDWLKDLSCE